MLTTQKGMTKLHKVPATEDQYRLLTTGSYKIGTQIGRSQEREGESSENTSNIGEGTDYVTFDFVIPWLFNKENSNIWMVLK